MQLNENLINKLKDIQEKFKTLEGKLSEQFSDQKEFAKLSKEYSELKEIVPLIENYFKCIQSITDSEELINDPEMAELAKEELYEAKGKLPEIEQEIKIALLPKDEADDKNIILEIRAGTGGDEAAIFAGNLFDMYIGYANSKKWKVEVLEKNESESGGYKEIIAKISGNKVFAELKYESGVHRVQRVPATETQGRLHTSAATVAIMPEADEIDIQINPSELRIDTYRSSGAGGQHVNTTDSAVRITHIPTGTVAQCQDERSQIANKERCFQMLYTKLYDLKRQESETAQRLDRQSKVGTGDRSARIRTYNYPQNRVSDHRINLTLYKIDEITAGSGLQEVINALKTEDQLEKLSQL